MSGKNGWWDTEEDILGVGMTDFSSYKVDGCLFEEEKPYYVVIKDIGNVLCEWDGYTFVMIYPITRMDIPRYFEIDPLTILAVKDIYSKKDLDFYA